jgi:uncharacterized protein YdeI (YjbR/CyaY-like superfamily)
MSSQRLFLHFANREDWRQWLQENHTTHKEVWLIFYKNKTGKQNISYEASVEEALCFGWIDSIIKSIDEHKYARKYTPRTNVKNWSDLNIKRVKKLIEEGKMEEAGLCKIDSAILKDITFDKKDTKQKTDKGLIVPDFIIKFLSQHEPALANFNKLAPSHKRHYILWITNAKTEPTIQKRLMETVALLKENKKLGLK